MSTDLTLERAAALTWRALVMAAGVAVAVLALARLRLVVLPVIIALLLSTVLIPPVGRLQRYGVPRLLATWLVLFGSVGLFVGALVLVAPSVADEFDDLGTTVRAGFEEVQTWLVEGPLELSREEIDRYSDQIVEQVRAGSGSIASGVLAGAVLAGEVIAGILLVLVLLFFFVKDGDKLCNFGLRQVRPEHRDLARALGRRVWTAAGGYVRGTALVAVVDAVLIGIGLLIIGVPLVAPLVLLTFFGAFFPLVGAVAAGLVAVLVALVSGGPGDALLTLGVVVIVQQVEGDVLAPLVLGRAVRLHPIVVLLALTGGAIIGGLIGAFLAVPTTAVAVAVGSELRQRGLIGPGPPDEEAAGAEPAGQAAEAAPEPVPVPEPAEQAAATSSEPVPVPEPAEQAAATPPEPVPAEQAARQPAATEAPVEEPAAPLDSPADPRSGGGR